MYYIYLLFSKLKNQTYIGSTNDLKKRLKEHNHGKIKSTKPYRPWYIYYYEAYLDEKQARIREMKLKQHGNAKRELKKRIGLSELSKKIKSSAGFTFIEVLLVVSIIGLMAGLAIPFYQSFQVGSQLDDTIQEVAQTLRRAQAKAMASESLSDFGVHFASGEFILFKGSSYSPADPDNESVELPSILTLNSGAGPEVIYSAVYGTTTNIGSITVTSSQGKSKVININNLGTIDVL